MDPTTQVVTGARRFDDASVAAEYTAQLRQVVGAMSAATARPLLVPATGTGTGFGGTAAGAAAGARATRVQSAAMLSANFMRWSDTHGFRRSASIAAHAAQLQAARAAGLHAISQLQARSPRHHHYLPSHPPCLSLPTPTLRAACVPPPYQALAAFSATPWGKLQRDERQAANVALGCTPLRSTSRHKTTSAATAAAVSRGGSGGGRGGGGGNTAADDAEGNAALAFCAGRVLPAGCWSPAAQLPDGLHPNARGQRFMGELLATLLAHHRHALQLRRNAMPTSAPAAALPALSASNGATTRAIGSPSGGGGGVGASSAAGDHRPPTRRTLACFHFDISAVGTASFAHLPFGSAAANLTWQHALRSVARSPATPRLGTDAAGAMSGAAATRHRTHGPPRALAWLRAHAEGGSLSVERSVAASWRPA